jgi:hypothetical protein
VAQITHFRLSFIWVETVPAILAKQVPLDRPYGFLGHAGPYAQAFDECQGKRSARALQLPWLQPKGHHFWKYYFGGHHAGDVIGAEGWRKQVPFRSALPRPITAIDRDMRLTFEAFYAPTGLALVVNAYYRGAALAPAAMAALALAVRYHYRFKSEAAPSAGRLLDAAAEDALEMARRYAFGAVDATGGGPFSIATVIEGSDVDLTAEVKPGSEEHRALVAMSEWQEDPAPSRYTAEALKKGTLTGKKPAVADLLYAARSGRAVWLPREFVGSSKHRTPRLSCYHRNLTLSSVQSLLLGRFVEWVAGNQRPPNTVPSLLIERAKRAGQLLSTCAAGELNQTYRSHNVDTLIRDAGWQASLDCVKNL